MSEDIVNVELQRERWRRARQSLHLVDPDAPNFSMGGLASRVGDPRVRLLVLPGDPERNLIEFDEAFHAWWAEPRLDPVTGQTVRWAFERTMTPTAATEFERGRDSKWDSYLALHRHGGLEVESGEDAIWIRSRGPQQAVVFLLLRSVGRVWRALDFYRTIVAKFSVGGPWEITLALRETKGAYLGGFATGWLEPTDPMADPRPIPEPGLLFREEVLEWPDQDGVRALAFQLGARVDNAWGAKERRFLVAHGQLAGQFDRQKNPR